MQHLCREVVPPSCRFRSFSSCHEYFLTFLTLDIQLLCKNLKCTAATADKWDINLHFFIVFPPHAFFYDATSFAFFLQEHFVIEFPLSHLFLIDWICSLRASNSWHVAGPKHSKWGLFCLESQQPNCLKTTSRNVFVSLKFNYWAPIWFRKRALTGVNVSGFRFEAFVLGVNPSPRLWQRRAWSFTLLPTSSLTVISLNQPNTCEVARIKGAAARSDADPNPIKTQVNI